jgi:hypothetical protein
MSTLLDFVIARQRVLAILWQILVYTLWPFGTGLDYLLDQLAENIG